MLKNGTGGDAQGHACVVFLWDGDYIQVMPTMMKKISNTVHTIALVSGAMGAPFFCRLYQMHLFGDHQLIANMSSFQTDSFNVMQNIIGSAPLLMRMSGYDRDFTAFSTDGHLFQAR